MEEVLEITMEQWRLHAASYEMADIRDEAAYAYGHVPGAVHIPLERLLAAPPVPPEGRKCQKANNSGGNQRDKIRKRKYKKQHKQAEQTLTIEITAK